MWEKEVVQLNNELNQLKNEFDEYISPKPVFTNEDKIRIRKKISQTKIHRITPSLIPNLLTVALVLIGVFFVGNFVINEVNFSQKDAAMPEPSSAPDDELPMSDHVENEAIKEATTDGLESTSFNYNNELLTEDLVEPYQDFAETKDEELLRYLSPIDIFFLYYHAYAIEDYETMYALYIDDEMYLKPFPTVTSFLDAIETENQVQLQFIKDEIINNDNLKEVIDDESHAGVLISEEKGLFFGISKNENGIWKVNWLPIQ
jgi:hypothetical protein